MLDMMHISVTPLAEPTLTSVTLHRLVSALPDRREGVCHSPALRMQAVVPGAAEHEHRNASATRGFLVLPSLACTSVS
jgi:hypothetical protein